MATTKSYVLDKKDIENYRLKYMHSMKLEDYIPRDKKLGQLLLEYKEAASKKDYVIIDRYLENFNSLLAMINANNNAIENSHLFTDIHDVIRKAEEQTSTEMLQALSNNTLEEDEEYDYDYEEDTEIDIRDFVWLCEQSSNSEDHTDHLFCFPVESQRIDIDDSTVKFMFNLKQFNLIYTVKHKKWDEFPFISTATCVLEIISRSSNKENIKKINQLQQLMKCCQRHIDELEDEI